MQKITVLTRPVSIKASFAKLIRNSLRFLRTLIKTGVIDFEVFIYYGHTAVTKSLINGLKDIEANFNYNPFSIKDIGDVVIVLSDVKALGQMADLRRNGKIKKLLVGPNVMEISTKHDRIMTQEGIDLILVPSKNIIKVWEATNPLLTGKIDIWYAGVDTSYWEPTEAPKNKKVLVYWKNASKNFNLEVESILKRNGYSINRIVYGKYSKKQFKKALDKSAFAVFLSITETQGLALVESWSTDTPTIVWNPEVEHYYTRGIKISAAPYLSEMTGVSWKEFGDLELLLKNKDFYKGFSPRKWVLENMSDKRSAEMLIKLIESIK